MGDAAGGGDRLDVVGILEGLQAVPDAHAAAEHDRDLDQMHEVDEPGGDEVAYDGGAATDPDILAKSRLTKITNEASADQEVMSTWRKGGELPRGQP